MVQYPNMESIVKKGKEAIGVKFYQIDTTGKLRTGKGAIGTLIEENLFFASTFCRKLQVKNTECCIMENP